MTYKINGSKLPSWYKRGRFVDCSVLDISEREVTERDLTAPPDALNCLSVCFGSADEKSHEPLLELLLYNYRILKKNFEFVSDACFWCIRDELILLNNGQYYIELDFGTDYGSVKLLALTFEYSDLRILK